MGTHDSNHPSGAERPRRRMVLRKIADGAPLLPRAKEPSVAALPPRATSRASAPVASKATVQRSERIERIARGSAPARSSTIRPPVDPAGEAAVPIPLTRLHTPRAAFRSAIDFPTPGTTDEASVRETSTASLPPLVASLPPAASPIYVPAPSTRTARASRAGRSAMLGSLAALALVATLGGVAMGRRIAQPAAGAESQAPIVLVPSPVVGASAPPPAAVAVPEAPAAAAMPDPIVPTSTVDDLPKATSQAVIPAPAVARPAARPSSPPVAAAAPAAPAVSAVPAARASLGGPRPQSTPGAAVQSSAKDPAEAEDSVAVPAIPPSPPPEVDPLVRAVKDDIQEEESRRR